MLTQPPSQGPITEEVTFRSLLTPLHLLSLLPPTKTILLTPLYFGIAHIHHFYEYTLTHPHTPLLPALLRSVVQFAYTTLFGWYATFLFLRIGSLPAVVLVHAFCNWCGLPRVWGRLEGVEREAPRGKEDDRASGGNGERLAVGWSVAYYVILVAGAVAFQKGLWPLTASERALATVE